MPASGTATKLEISTIRTPASGRAALGAEVTGSSYQARPAPALTRQLDGGGLDRLLRQQHLERGVAERNEAVGAGDAVDGAGVTLGEQGGQDALAHSAGLPGFVDDQRLTAERSLAQHVLDRKGRQPPQVDHAGCDPA